MVAHSHVRFQVVPGPGMNSGGCKTSCNLRDILRSYDTRKLRTWNSLRSQVAVLPNSYGFDKDRDDIDAVFEA